MEFGKVKIMAKIYFAVSLIFLFQLLTKLTFVSTEAARQTFVILPGDFKSIIYLVIIGFFLIIILMIRKVLNFINKIFRTNFTTKRLSGPLKRKVINLGIIIVLFFVSAGMYFFIIPKFTDINLLMNSKTFINAFLFSFLSSFLISDKLTPLVKERFNIDRKHFRVWPIITIILIVISILVVSIIGY